MDTVPSPDIIKHHFAGVFLITDTRRVIGQQRDDNPNIDNPGKVGPFGGTIEHGEEPVQAAWRELVTEETNLNIAQESLHPLFGDTAIRKLTGELEARHFFWTRISEEELQNLKVYEGQGWAYISGPNDPKAIPEWNAVYSKVFEFLKSL